MPNNTIKLSDFKMDARCDALRDAIVFGLEESTPLAQYCNKKVLAKDATTFSFKRLIAPKLDKSDSAYKNGLAEGKNPVPGKLTKVEQTVGVQRWAAAYEFTQSFWEHSYANAEDEIRVSLKSQAVQYINEKQADAFLSSTNVVTGIDFGDVADFLQLANILMVNGAKKIDGYYVLLLHPSVYSKICIDFMDKVSHTSEREAPVKGEIGYFMGFRMIPVALQAFQPTGNAYPFAAFGTSSDGETFPVTTVSYDGDANGAADVNGQVRLIVKDFGTVKNDDYTNQTGAMSIEFAGTNTVVVDDSVLVNGTSEISSLENPSKFDPSKLSNLTGNAENPSGVAPELTTVKVKDGSTQTFKVYKADGTLWTTGASVTSSDSAVATAAFGSSDGIVTVTGKKPGLCYVVVSETADPTRAALVTVEVTGPEKA